MADETLVLLATEVRGKTLRLLEGVPGSPKATWTAVPEAQARYTGPAGLSNSILWHAGHALVVVEHLCVAPATGRPPAYPPGWFNAFGWDSTPAAVTAWPTLAEVVERLREQIQRLTQGIQSLAPGQLDQALHSADGRTRRYSIVHGLHDEANHQGEIYLLKKILTRQPAPAGETVL